MLIMTHTFITHAQSQVRRDQKCDVDGRCVAQRTVLELLGGAHAGMVRKISKMNGSSNALHGITWSGLT